MSDFLDDIRELLSPRQRPAPTPEEDDGLTIIAVTTMTAAQTFAGDAVLVTETPFAGGVIAGGAIFASRSQSASDESAATTEAPSFESNTLPAISIPAETTAAAFTPDTNSLNNPLSNPGAFGVTSSRSGASATSSNAAPASEGLSGGAKAGIAFGVLIPLAALLIGALLLIRRKKQNKKDAGDRLDDEKTAMAGAPAFPSSAPAPASNSFAQAPVLPQMQQTSQFEPRLNTPSSSNGGAMAAGAAVVGAAAVTRKPAPSEQQNAWERTGNEKNANDPANPFGNHAETTTMHNVAPAQQARAPSPSIDASDFPLPGSVAPSERAISIAATPSSDNISISPKNHAGQSTLSLAAPSTPAPSLGMAAAAGLVGAAAAGASKRDSPPSPPPADNVYRVQLDFKPSMEDELDIRAGQLVRMVHGYDDGWALCMKMDRSQQGVVPRTCLSKNTVKPRPNNPPPNQQRGPNGPGPRGPNSPAMRGPPQGRPMTPQGGRNSPAPYAQQGRPMSPAGGRNSPAPGGRPRAGSNASAAPYAAYNTQARSMSPGPYGAPGGMMPPPSRPDAASRTRSNSLGSAGNQAPQIAPVKPLSPSNSTSGGVARKPVPGMAV